MAKILYISSVTRRVISFDTRSCRDLLTVDFLTGNFLILFIFRTLPLLNHGLNIVYNWWMLCRNTISQYWVIEQVKN